MEIKKSFNIGDWPGKLKNFIKSIPGIVHTIYLFLTFFIILLLFLFEKVYGLFERIPVFGHLFKTINIFWKNKMGKFITTFISKLESGRSSQVERIYLIKLAYKNMMIKKTRSFITIFGMSVGVGAIVLLLSFGYGVERLIINKVAGLNELKMVDISAGENTALRLNQDVFNKINKIKEKSLAMPIISVVGRINYNRAQTDILAYAVPKDYLLHGINIKFLKGKPFANNTSLNEKLSLNFLENGQVAGSETKIEYGTINERIIKEGISFNLNPEKAVMIWESCSTTSKMIGYGTRIVGGYTGYQYWGSDYYPFSQNGRVGFDKKNNTYLGKWIKAKFPIFEKKADGVLIPTLDNNGVQRWDEGCVAQKDINILVSEEFGSVLGISTGSAEVVFTDDVLAATDSADASSSAIYGESVVATDEAGIETVSLQASASAQKKQVETLKFAHKPDGEAVVSSGFLNLLSINVNKAIGTTFKSSFIIVKSLMPDIEGKVLTSEVEYKIIGVIDDADNTYFYVPFSDIQRLGIKNFSQFKLVLSNQKDLPKIRKDIETMGLRTSSTYDTVKQIESLFANLRLLLAVLGMVALGVASLGMFNTLTVSLLERTRETGGMKAIGMVSDEVQDLFLAEAMIMGLSGGIGGLIFGFLIGEVFSILISIIAITKGQGFLQLNYLPPYFVAFIIICAFVVGLLTGLYPAYRAKKTSALNALRYE
ncbi:ABC transporter permease [candidate division WS5 bacterium]|uniref:ABC transporter permease n=1 Tax=candidate division WS5 bacterium TaxID=2093353 RepID=A0A419D9Z4_9BACT|nr:MAG: ABC transporter permease [candidate division WS5 bacterium]